MNVANAKELLVSIIELLTSGLVQMGQGIGQGVSSMVESLVFSTTGDTSAPSAFILMVALVGGISLAVSMGRRIFNFVASLGGKR